MSYNTTAPPHPNGNSVGAPVPDSYFTESRKGEVNELRNLLRGFGLERDMKRKREIIKKVIAYMTLGIDVSRLFTEMMLVIETRDLVIKKMVYLFLSNYATVNPELAQMCTNTLTKDCNNDDPMVRGLALRSLCSLRLPQMVEYIAEPLRRALSDSHAYVRKTAVMGILKLYHLDEDILERNGFVDTLYDMLKDPDAAVVTNCILVLNELMAKNGGMAINRAIMLHLLNRLGEFGEFGVVAVLDLVPRYIPANEDEGYQIMNLLDPVLSTTNAGAFMAVIFAFLSLSENVEGLKEQIIDRVKAPLITMMTGGSHELMYVILKHVDTLIELCPGVFDDEYRQFYIRFHEPTSVKYLKTEILAKLVNPSNAPDIVGELAECVASNDSTLSRLSVRALTRIACRDVGGEGCAENITVRLVEMVDLDISHVNSEAATALSAIIRRHPQLKDLIAPPLPRALKYMKEGSGKASLIYLLGECGDIISEAPYSLERFIDGYDSIKDPEVKIALLTSTMKLFFHRSPEVQKMLGRLLQKATEDVSSQDLHDRALLYYRLLRTAPNPKIVEQIVSTHLEIGSATNFSEENIDTDIRDELTKEFNTLSIIYGTTCKNFISEENIFHFVKMPPEHPLDGNQSASVSNLTKQVEESMQLHDEAAEYTNAQPTAAPVIALEADLLGFGPEPTHAIEPSPAPVHSPGLGPLDANVGISGEEYQAMWEGVPDSDAHVVILPLKLQPPNTDSVEIPLAKMSIKTMASGELPSELKFFLYAKEASTELFFLVQATISKGTTPCELLLTIKMHGSDGVEKANAFVDTISNALSAYT
jgi:AP-4 complex subunit beta-1